MGNTGNRHLPPGPRPLPIVGNLLKLGSDESYNVLAELCKQYRPMCGFWLGSQYTVIPSTADVTRELMLEHGDSTLARPPFLVPIQLTDGKGLLMQTNMEHMKELRQFASAHLKGDGVGKKSLEERIVEELTALMIRFDQETDAFDVRPLLESAMTNIMHTVVYGSRLEYDSDDMKNLLATLASIFKSGGARAPENFMPWLDRIPCRTSSAKRVKEVTNNFKEAIRQVISEHEEAFDEHSIRDMVDSLIKKSREQQDPDGAFSATNMVQMILDMFLAGSDTGASALHWSFLYLILNRDVQKKCREEILEVIGASRRPCVQDRGSLPYTEATIMEILRLGCMVPTAIPHYVTQEVKIGDYVLPANTTIMFNIYGIHRDPDNFPEPEVFNPDRWIDKDGKHVENTAYFPFGIGQRWCLGEQLAAMVVFLCLTSLLPKYEFTVADPAHPPEAKGFQGATRTPVTFKMIARKI